ncbi:hypothetical protein [Nocardia tengchongensis]|uniref:hypothetical protein n=1 Tax=Nocardia tengchongensis TaxID=2055889 RepID=UPI0036ADA116
MTTTEHDTADATGEPVDAVTIGQTIEEIVAEIHDSFGNAFEQMRWGEEEIAAAQARHPARADELWHSFILLSPIHKLMSHELVYRAYCREILDRVATGKDTRRGTAIEVLLVMKETSLVAPLSTAAAGLYFRMWQAANMPDIDPEGNTADLTNYEAIAGREMDEMEAEVRRRILRSERVLPEHITCGGLHNAEPVQCRFTAGKSSPRPRAMTASPAQPTGPAEQLSLL